MRKGGYAEATIERYVRLLKEPAKCGDLRNSESVKVALTRTGWADGTKEMACGEYAIYAKQHGFRPKQETTSDLAIPEPAKLMIPVFYARLYNVKGSIRRRTRHLGLENSLQSRPANANY
jgi:hypothetical protein